MSMLVMLLGGAATGSILQPSILSPGAGNIANNRTPTLVGSDFSSTPGISHASTDWQVASDSAFSNIVWESLANTTNKTSITTGDLGAGVRYVRVRYKGDNDIYSSYSPTIEFISPWASGSSVIQNSATTAVVTASTTATLLAGTYRITLWGGGGGGAPKSQSGGGAGATKRIVTYSNATNTVPFTIGQGGGAATGSADSNSNIGGSGGSPGGAAGMNVGTNYWNGGGGGGYSSAVGMTAAGGGGAGGDFSAPGGPGGSGTAAGGSRYTNISSNTSRSGGFSIENSYALNLDVDTGCNISGYYSVNVSFSNRQGKLIDVKLVATGPSGTLVDEQLCTTGANLSISTFTGNYNRLQVYYRWCGSGATNISHNLSASWNGVGTIQTASSGTAGGGGGGGSNLAGGPGSSGGQGGDNTGTFDDEANGSGASPGFSYSYGGYTYGLGGTDSTPGNNGAALIEKL